MSWPEPRGGCRPLLTERGVQLVEGVSVGDVGGCVHERSVLCGWRSALYVGRVMRLGDEALNRVHAELEVALRRAGRGGLLQRNTSQTGVHVLTKEGTVENKRETRNAFYCGSCL